MLKRSGLVNFDPGGSVRSDTTLKRGVVLKRKLPSEESKEIMQKAKDKLETSRKKQRAEKRKEAFGNQVELLEGKTFLERRSVTLAREMSYVRAMNLFTNFAKAERMKTDTLIQLDLAATRYLNHMFWDGEDLSAGQTLGAALVFFRDDVNKVTGLPRLNAALRGFRKLEPPQGRVPLPLPFAMLRRICQVLHHRGQDQVALWLMTIWVEKLKTPKDPQARIFKFSREHAVEQFDSVVRQLKYQNVGIQCVYQLRHGSASTDALEKFRTLEQIQKRGRWQCVKSVRRYSNGGRISQVFQELSMEDQQLATAAESEITKIIGPSIWAKHTRQK